MQAKHNHQAVRRALDWLLARIALSNVKFRDDSRRAPIGLVRAGLPWDWRTGPSDSSERQHSAKMLDGLAFVPGWQ